MQALKKKIYIHIQSKMFVNLYCTILRCIRRNGENLNHIFYTYIIYNYTKLYIISKADYNRCFLYCSCYV